MFARPRRLRLCTAFAWAMCSSVAGGQAQIEIPAQAKLGEPIVATYKLADGGRIAWRASPGTSVVNVGLGRAHVWAPPGRHYLEAVVARVSGGELSELEWLRQEYSVEGAGPVPPTPNPTPTPTPTPPAPPQPQPQPGTLGALVPDPAHRRLLAEFYADWASMIRAGMLTTTGNFRAAQQRAAAALKAAGKLPDYPALNEPISRRIAAAVGLADATLDAAKREALAAALDGIARELGG